MDLEEVACHFDTEPMRAIKDGDKYYLCGQSLAKLDDATVVRDTAQSWLDEASAVISLLWPGFRKPSVGNVFRQHEDGNRDAWIFVHAGEIRFHAGGKLTAVGAEGQQVPTVPVAVMMLNAARADRHLHRALLLWSDKPRSWNRLYVVTDELQNYVQGSLAAAGHCSSTDLDRFAHTANNAEAAGLDARHALNPKQQAPMNPMTLQDAEIFVQRTMSSVLRRAAGLA